MFSVFLAVCSGVALASFKTGGIGSGVATATTSSDIQGYFPNTAQKADDVVAAALGGTLTQTQLDEVLNGVGATSGVDLSNPVNLDYVQNCIANLVAPNAGTVAACASNATSSGAARFELGGIVGGDYPAAQLAASTLLSAGAVSDSGDYSVVSGNYCGANGTSSCVALLQGSLSQAVFSTPPSTAEIDNWVNSVISSDLQAQANAFIPSNPSDAPGC